MRSMAFIQSEDNKFISLPLPKELQLSTIEDFYVDNDKIYYVGNFSGYVSELGPSYSNPGGVLTGLGSLLSTVQMPKGVPVATMSVGKHGAINAAILSAEILALNDDSMKNKLIEFKANGAKL